MRVSTGGDMQDVSRTKLIEYVLKLGIAFHAAGYPADRVEQVMSSASRRLGLQGQFFSTPTSLLAGFGPIGCQQTRIIRVDVGNVNLAQLAALDGVAGDVEEGRATPGEGLARISSIESSRRPWRPAQTMIAFALASAAGTRLLGGGLHEILAALLTGLALGVSLFVLSRRLRTLELSEFVGGMIAASFVATLVAGGYRCALSTTILGGLVTLLPGLTMTTAMGELATRHLASGTARLGGAVVALLALGSGAAIGLSTVDVLTGPLRSTPVVPLADWTSFAAFAVAPLAFGVLLDARPKDLPRILGVAWIGLAGMKLGQSVLGPELGVSFGALAIGLAANGVERLGLGLGIVVTVPSVLMLVPGSLGFRSITALLDQNVIRGVEAWWAMLLTAIALAAGLVLANVLLPPRRALPQTTSGPGMEAEDQLRPPS